jgi:hypothetical protein
MTKQVGFCNPGGACSCQDELPIGLIGTYASMALTPTGTVFLSAYNATYGDLMVTEVNAAGKIDNDAWTFVDGVPAGPVFVKGSHVRGGIQEPGDDVGWYTSTASTPTGEPVVSYYDATHASLRFAQRIGGVWSSHTVDAGVPMAKDIGKYTAITVDAMGRPAIAYLAMIGGQGSGHSEVRFAQALRAHPTGPADWMTSAIASKDMPAESASEMMLDDLPNVAGLFVAQARTPAGYPVVAYYDRTAGALELVVADAGGFAAPVVVDGGTPAADVGWYPSLAVSPDGTIHIAYVDADRSALRALDYPGGKPYVVDDGLRMDGTTTSGDPRPVYHHVGDNSAIVNDGKVRGIVYQDATTQDLLLASPGLLGIGWVRTTIAGGDQPYRGAFGFYASGALTSDDFLFSASYVIDQATNDQWVEVFRQKLNPPPIIIIPG